MLRLSTLIAVLTTIACERPAPPKVVSPPAALSLVDAAPSRLATEVHRTGAAATIVNVWATWCEPCVAEFPDVVKTARGFADRKVRLVLISADFEENRTKALAFLKAQGIDFPTWRKTGDDQAFIDALDKRWQGSIPLTLVLDAKGAVQFLREGSITGAELRAAVEQVLSTPK